MILTDYHLHTNFSVDSKTDMEEMTKKAISLGLCEIAFTDHQDFLPDGSDYDFAIDYDKYMLRFSEIKKKYSDKINIVLGAEIGLMPHLKYKAETFAASRPFEFIIGSSHDTMNLPHYTGEFFNGKDKKTAYTEYLSEIAADILSTDCFDVFGHIDYIARYGKYADNSLKYEDYPDLIDQILKSLIERGKGLELNTSGVRYGLGDAHPQISILKRYRELGGEIITVGSDAHQPEHICHSFAHALEKLKSAGFKAYALFRDRKPYFIDLP